MTDHVPGEHARPIDVRWPRRATWCPPREFDRDRALATIQAVTTESVETIRSYDDETDTTTTGSETFYTPAPDWGPIASVPELGREEAWFYYTILWKPHEVSIADATSESFPADPLARVREDLASNVTPEWFDARAYWCCVAGMLSRVEVARFVGDARVFAHSWEEGGTSIITSHADRVRFLEAFYQTIVPRFGADEWDTIQEELGAIGPAILKGVDAGPLVAARLRLAAASGRYDSEILALLPTLGVPVFDVLHALRDPAHLAAYAPALKARLLDELVLEKWLDRFGTSEPDWIVESVVSGTNRKLVAPLVAALIRLVPAPELAPIMNRLLACKAASEVSKWLARHGKSPPEASKKGPSQ